MKRELITLEEIQRGLFYGRIKENQVIELVCSCGKTIHDEKITYTGNINKWPDDNAYRATAICICGIKYKGVGYDCCMSLNEAKLTLLEREETDTLIGYLLTIE